MTQGIAKRAVPARVTAPESRALLLPVQLAGIFSVGSALPNSLFRVYVTLEKDLLSF